MMLFVRSHSKPTSEGGASGGGLMMIMEEVLLDSMYTLPSEKRAKELFITREMIERRVPVFDVVRPLEEAA